MELINRHLSFEWDKTHFLSFSTEENVALKYGMNRENFDPTNIESSCSKQFDDEENWNFVVVKLLTSKINFKQLGKGIYKGTYAPSLLKFANNNCKLILINVLDVLVDTDYSVALENAKRDKEWLLLPANLFNERGQYEYSAVFDIGNIGEIQKYIKHD